MEYLLLTEDGDASVVKGRELTKEEMAKIEDNELAVFRYQGNTFELAEVESDTVTEDEDDEEGETTYELSWSQIPEEK